MPSPLGHSLASLALCAYRTDARSIRLIVCAQIAGMSPDIDLLLSFFISAEQATTIHWYTHNVFFPMLVAIPLAIISGKNLRSWLFFSSLGWIHCLFDALLGWPVLSSPTQGIPFFYPIHTELVPGSIALFPPVLMGENPSFGWRSLVVLGYELALFTILNVFVWLRRLLGYNQKINLKTGL